MIEQSKTNHQIEAAEPRQGRIFGVRNMEIDSGMAAARFLNIFRARVRGGDLQSQIPQHGGKRSNAAADIERGSQAKV